MNELDRRRLHEILRLLRRTMDSQLAVAQTLAQEASPVGRPSPLSGDLPDLLAALEPTPAAIAEEEAEAPAEDGPPVGLIEGPAEWWEGFGAGLRCWTGKLNGWRQLGDLVGLPEVFGRPPTGGILVHQGRLSVSLSWDLGPVSYKALQKAAKGEEDGGG